MDTTAALLEAAANGWADRPETAAFVLISSLAAHGPAGLDQPAVETDPCRPITAYGRSKLAAEKLVWSRDWPFRTAILRPPALYGPRDREFLPLFKLALRGWTGRHRPEPDGPVPGRRARRRRRRGGPAGHAGRRRHLLRGRRPAGLRLARPGRCPGPGGRPQGPHPARAPGAAEAWPPGWSDRGGPRVRRS